MADLDILPAWAVNHLTEHVADHAHIINALPIDQGKWRGAYLINTSLGALVLHKGRMGEPRHWLLPLPGRRVGFSCHSCHERMEFVDPELPRDTYCSHCGSKYHMTSEGGKLVVRKESTKKGFTHDGYSLYRSKGTKGQSLYFFAKGTPKAGEPAEKPDGFTVGVNKKTGLPYLEGAADTVQCGATTAAGGQCRLTAREGSKYCHLHKGYRPSKAGADTKPVGSSVKDTTPSRRNVR